MNKKTILFSEHLRLGARMVPFGGWEMPVQYSSITEEHAAVRTRVGLFDIGHMGVIEIKNYKPAAAPKSPAPALSFLQYVTTNDVSRLENYQFQYTVACNETGGTVDDLLVGKLPDKYIVVANAANTEKVLAWLEKQRAAKNFELYIRHATEISMLSLQGPNAAALIEKIAGRNVTADKKNRSFVWVAGSPVLAKDPPGIAAGCEILISRTGYTGEDGFEFFAPKDFAVELWNRLLLDGAAYKIKPCGLGARDTLRLEAALPLYGHEYDDDTSPIEAGYGWAVKFDKGEFIGRDRLLQQKENGLPKKLFGLELPDKNIPRAGYAVYADITGQSKIGQITSGTFSPTLGKPIGLAYLQSSDLINAPAVGNIPRVYVKIREKFVPASVVSTPFYKKNRASTAQTN